MAEYMKIAGLIGETSTTICNEVLEIRNKVEGAQELVDTLVKNMVGEDIGACVAECTNGRVPSIKDTLKYTNSSLDNLLQSLEVLAKEVAGM